MADRSKHSADLDPVDRKILWVLCSDGRLTMNELAEKVGLSASPCWRRVKRVEENGTIEKYVALLKHNAPSLTNIAFVEITLEKHDHEVLKRFGDALASVPEVLETPLVTGDCGHDAAQCPFSAQRHGCRRVSEPAAEHTKDRTPPCLIRPYSRTDGYFAISVPLAANGSAPISAA